MNKIYNILLAILFISLITSCTLRINPTAYRLPSAEWYESQNHDELSYWIIYWERVLDNENKKCYHNYPHDHRYHDYVRAHLSNLYNYRAHMNMRNACHRRQNNYKIYPY